MTIKYVATFIIILLSLIDRINSSITCKDENNSSLDWFIIIKYPGSSNFVYLSSKSANTEWYLPNYSLDSNQSTLGVTLQQAFRAASDNSFVAFYNDEKPFANNLRKSNNGEHLKGVVNFDKSSGYWLVHSAPRFPQTTGYYYPDGQKINAQAFFCVTFGINNLKQIAEQLLMMYADVYFSNLPPDISDDTDLIALLIRLINNNHFPDKVSKVIKLVSSGNANLKHFGKSKLFDGDLYKDLMVDKLEAGLYVQSWLKDPQLRSNCSGQYPVYNVMKVKLNQMVYENYNDHSKWAVSDHETIPSVCIGDINRMMTQFDKGGGMLCMFDVNVWRVFRKSVYFYENCTEEELQQSLFAY